MLRLVISSVRHNLGRYLATLIAIMTGVGFYTAVGVVSDGVISSLEGNVDAEYGNVDVAVVPDENATADETAADPEPLKVPQTTVDQLLALPGVDGGAGILTGSVAFLGPTAHPSRPRRSGGCGSPTRTSTRSRWPTGTRRTARARSPWTAAPPTTTTSTSGTT